MVISSATRGLIEHKVGWFISLQIEIIVNAMPYVVQMVFVVLTILLCVIACMDLYQKSKVIGKSQIGQVVVLEELPSIALLMGSVSSLE
jgi:hypothetical protein